MTRQTNRAPVRQKRKVSYEWRLREVMAEQKMYATTELVPLLAERGIILSASQVHRLVTSTPERLSLPILAALCDIFAVDAAELIPTDATNVGVRKAVDGDRPARPARSPGIGDLRPVRARIVTPE
jgi:DNA-binding Xre family transcriptional regulator